MQADEFLDWARSVGREYKDWDSAVRNSLRRAHLGSNGSSAQPADLSEEEIEEAVRRWLWEHPDNDPVCNQLFVDGKMDEFNQRSRQREAERREQARAEVLRAQMRVAR